MLNKQTSPNQHQLLMPLKITKYPQKGINPHSSLCGDKIDFILLWGYTFTYPH